MNALMTTLVVIGIIAGVVFGAASAINWNYQENEKKSVIHEATLIDKFTTGGNGGNLYCIYETSKGLRFQTYSMYQCMDYVVGDEVKLKIVDGKIWRVIP